MSIGALIAGLLSGIIGAMGLGGGAVLIIYLSVFTATEQLTAQGVNLIFFVPIAVLAVIIYAIRKEIKWKTVSFMALGGIVGATFGVLATGALGGELTAKIFGFGLVLLGVLEVFSKRKACKNREKTKKVLQAEEKDDKL